LGQLVGVLLILLAAGCNSKQPNSAPASSDTCKASDGPTNETVRQAIVSVPVVTPGSMWVEIGRGHAKKCRLSWVQIIPTIADESTPQQIVFFDHNRSLGTPTPNPEPYISVLAVGDDNVTVQYRWRVGSDQACCPTGVGTVKFQIGSDGKLQALGKIPHQ
jgi:LppP/LprE lipoprotein